MKQNKIVALTGGIGSGKSLALKILKDAGYKVFSCDEETNNLYKKHFIKRKLKTLFPTAVKGKFFLKVDKKIISKICFKDKEKLSALQDILTYKSYENAIIKAEKYPFCVIEIPLLFECDLEENFNRIIVIKRNLKDRIKSVMNRSNKTEEEVKSIIETQVDYDKKDLSSYTVIENDKSIEELKAKILKAIKKYNE